RIVHILIMQGFVKAMRNRRRGLWLYWLAARLGKNPVTLWRWIKQGPELHRVLRVRKHGNYWRIDYPKTAGECDEWVEAVRKAVEPFTRTRKPFSEYAERVCARLGFGDERRERDIEILRFAMLLKYATRKLLP